MVNGKLVTLSDVQRGITLEPATAVAWSRMVAAARADGVTLNIAQGGGYTDIAAQKIRKHNGSASGISVAEPGYQTHGEGNRLDVASYGAAFGKTGLVRQSWVRANAARFGFVFEFGQADPNHLKFVGPPTSKPEPITRKGNPVISVTRILRTGVGEFIMYASPAGVRLTAELSTMKPEDRAFQIGVAEAVRVAADLPAALPVIDDSANGGWYIRNQLALAAAGMPNTFPLSPTNPWVAGGTSDQSVILTAIASLKVPTTITGTLS